MAGLVQRRASHSVPAFADAACDVGLAGLVALWRQTKMCTQSPGSFETVRTVNSGHEGQGRDRTHVGDAHQALAHRIGASNGHHPRRHVRKLALHGDEHVQNWRHNVIKRLISAGEFFHCVGELASAGLASLQRRSRAQSSKM